ncbi:PREDICTED: uncharacterized protein LOC105566818 isoform X2 [Vollenhovia emeryi]|uniref:uncharacterized protein LOC105566818 isoform X2 n=1 Tax=Vollenhovia emeryi TaxID=411798 RepID=UPI0005F4ABBF|nr:PREDICTED: uncharacterized protein LOC105566818 isoform X2 [Vollenhovia emeryi]
MMLGKMSVLIMAECLILNHASYVLNKRLNITELIREIFDPEFNYQDHLRDIPVARDVSYLPENYYHAENTARGLQQLNRDNRNLMPEYRNLCETVTKRVDFSSDPNYEYQPPHYYEVYCKGYSLLSEDDRLTKPLEQKCVHPVFHCVQRSRLLTFVRRLWDSECWEPYTKEIASGCDCMWPVTNLGEISQHY